MRALFGQGTPKEAAGVNKPFIFIVPPDRSSHAVNLKTELPQPAAKATEAEAQAYAAPHAHVERVVRNRRQAKRAKRAGRATLPSVDSSAGAPTMRAAIAGLDRFLAIVEVAKHRHFVGHRRMCYQRRPRRFCALQRLFP